MSSNRSAGLPVRLPESDPPLLQPEPGETSLVSVQVSVEDGMLDIKLGHETAAPAVIAAIEIEP